MPAWTTPLLWVLASCPGRGQAFDDARRAAAGRHRARRGQSYHPAAHDGDVDRRVAHRTCGRKRTRQGMASDSAITFSDTVEWPCRRSTKTMETSPMRAPWRRASWRVSMRNAYPLETRWSSGMRPSASDGQFVQQARHAEVARGETAAACPFDECTSEKALPDPARPGDD